MPASRSRTERWRDSLRKVYERDGALEISIPAGAGSPSRGADLLWRVRIVGLSDTEIVIEPPCAAGRAISLEPGINLVAVLAVGQNKWMFHTRTLPSGPAARGPRTVRLAMPQTVERVQRRNFLRISTAELSLPKVECWPLLDPTSVVAAEVANRALILDLLRGDSPAQSHRDEPFLLPEVGPKFHGRLMNIGGGGAGLFLDRNDTAAADKARVYWLRVDLTPQIPAPIAMTARLVHTHIDSGQNLYAGMAFEWAFHESHREFVVEQICRYVAALQNGQVAAQRRSA